MGARRKSSNNLAAAAIIAAVNTPLCAGRHSARRKKIYAEGLRVGYRTDDSELGHIGHMIAVDYLNSPLTGRSGNDDIVIQFVRGHIGQVNRDRIENRISMGEDEC